MGNKIASAHCGRTKFSIIDIVEGPNFDSSRVMAKEMDFDEVNWFLVPEQYLNSGTKNKFKNLFPIKEGERVDRSKIWC